MNKETKFIVKAAVTAAIYVILTWLTYIFGLSSGIFQVRISEALAILPIYSTCYIPGITIGCLISNILFGASILDIAVGTGATLLGALCTHFLRSRKLPAIASPIIINSLLVPVVLVLSTDNAYPYYLLVIFIFASELISTGILGFGLYKLIETNKELRKYIV